MLPATAQQLLPQTSSRPTREFAVSVLTGIFKKAVDDLPPEWLEKTLDELEKLRTPTEVDYFLRRNLWRQVEICQKGIRPDVESASIYSGVCSKQNFDKMTLSPGRVAWLLFHPAENKELYEYGLSLGLRNLIKFVSREPNDDNINAFVKAVEFLANRADGPLIQKLQAQHAHLHKNADKPLPAATPIGERLREIQDKLADAPIEVKAKKE